MFDTIILLTGPVEEGALTTALLRQNPHLILRPVKTLEELDAIEPRRLRRARLIAFASTVIVPARILRRLGFGAYNFHPGPPNYPGWAPSHFAVYDRATSFGVTAHVMLERVDSGPIIAVDLFGIPSNISAESLEAMAYARLARQFFELAKPLATSPHAPPALPMQWCGSKSTQRQCAELCEIPGRYFARRTGAAHGRLRRRASRRRPHHHAARPPIPLCRRGDCRRLRRRRRAMPPSSRSSPRLPA